MLETIRNVFRAAFRSSNSGQRIMQLFQQHRQQLRDEFFAQAVASGKPRGLRWKDCDWLATYTLVTDSEAKMHTLFCGVNLSFEAIEGGDMEDVEAVSMIRDGSAVFHHQNHRWGSGGRVIFNMDPDLAAQTMSSGQVVVARSGEGK